MSDLFIHPWKIWRLICKYQLALFSMEALTKCRFWGGKCGSLSFLETTLSLSRFALGGQTGLIGCCFDTPVRELTILSGNKHGAQKYWFQLYWLNLSVLMSDVTDCPHFFTRL